MIQTFLQAGMDINLTDSNNKIALERILFKPTALHGEGLLILDYLINSGFDFSVTSKTSWSVLGKMVSSTVRGVAVGMAAVGSTSHQNTLQPGESVW